MVVLAVLKTLEEDYVLVVLVVLGVLAEMRADSCLVVAVTSQMKTLWWDLRGIYRRKTIELGRLKCLWFGLCKL